MNIKEISDFLNTDVVFDIGDRHCGICPFDDVCYIGNGIETLSFETVEEAITSPVFDGKSVLDLWEVIFPQIS